MFPEARFDSGKTAAFHQEHQDTIDVLLADLEAAVGQLPYNTRNHEAEIVAEVLQQHANRRRGAGPIGDLLPAVLARLNIESPKKTKTGTGPEPV